LTISAIRIFPASIKKEFSFVEVPDFAKAELCAPRSSSMSILMMADAANFAEAASFVEVLRAPLAPF
jgi:hypothetical protein